MAPGEHAPYVGPDTDGVWQHLEDDVSIRGSVSRAPKRREAQRVGGVVDEVEPALQGVRRILRIGQAPEAGVLEPGEFPGIRRLPA